MIIVLDGDYKHQKSLLIRIIWKMNKQQLLIIINDYELNNETKIRLIKELLEAQNE